VSAPGRTDQSGGLRPAARLPAQMTDRMLIRVPVRNPQEWLKPENRYNRFC